MILCLIPCRAGSKRLNGKNGKLFNGKPLVEWTLEQARGIKFIDEIVLSSNDKNLVKYPEFELRPKAYAADDAPIELEISRLWNKYKPDLLIMLQVTTPQRTMWDIIDSFEQFREHHHMNAMLSVNPDNKPNGAIYMTRTGIHYDTPLDIFKCDDYYIDIDYEYEFKIAEAILSD